MKELSIEEKAKRYDGAIKVAENIHKFSSDPAEIKRMEQIFPELVVESGDERIRKRLIDFFEDWHKHSSHCWSIAVTDILSWLEKQAEQKPVISNNALREGIAHFGITQYQIDNWLKKYVDVEKQGEQKSTDDYNLTDIENSILNFAMQFHDNRMKPEAEWEDELKMLRDNIKIDPWSEEDENYHRICLDLCTGMPNGGVYAPYIKDEAINWFKSLKDRVQSKQEWSEEDEQYLLVCKNALAKYQTTDKWDANIIYHWLEDKLKSLRPQSTWKPSDEQMDVLLSEVSAWTKGCYKQIVLESLYNDLKKLKQ